MDVRQFFSVKTKTEPTLNLRSSINKKKPTGGFLYKDHPLLEEMRYQHEAKWADCVKRMAHGTPWAKKTPEERKALEAELKEIKRVGWVELGIR